MAAPYVKAEVRRRQLVAAARELLGQEGMAGATLRAVAVAAGVPLGTVHYIFPSKEQLLRAVLEDVAQEATRTRAAVSSGDLEDAIRGSALAIWTRLVEGDTGQQLMQYELTIWALRTPGMAEVARWQYELYLEEAAATWQEAASHAGVDLAVPAGELARLLLAGIDGLILQYLTIRDADRAKADLETLVQQTVRYATARQPRPVRHR